MMALVSAFWVRSVVNVDVKLLEPLFSVLKASTNMILILELPFPNFCWNPKSILYRAISRPCGVVAAEL